MPEKSQADSTPGRQSRWNKLRILIRTHRGYGALPEQPSRFITANLPFYSAKAGKWRPPTRGASWIDSFTVKLKTVLRTGIGTTPCPRGADDCAFYHHTVRRHGADWEANSISIGWVCDDLKAEMAGLARRL